MKLQFFAQIISNFFLFFRFIFNKLSNRKCEERNKILRLLKRVNPHFSLIKTGTSYITQLNCPKNSTLFRPFFIQNYASA